MNITEQILEILNNLDGLNEVCRCYDFQAAMNREIGDSPVLINIEVKDFGNDSIAGRYVVSARAPDGRTQMGNPSDSLHSAIAQVKFGLLK